MEPKAGGKDSERVSDGVAPSGDRSSKARGGTAREAALQTAIGSAARVQELRLPSQGPTWTITKLAATGTIVMRFVGATRTAEIPEFLQALTDMLPDENANIIFDLRELVGHNPETKQPMKRWLVEHKARLGEVTVVLDRRAAILKMVVAVISLASGIRIKVREDLEGSLLTNRLDVGKVG